MSDDLDIHGMSDRDILIFLAKTVPGRLNNHGKRLARVEKIVGSAATLFVAAGVCIGFFKDLIVGYVKTTILRQQ